MSYRKMCLLNNVWNKVNIEEYNRILILRNCLYFFLWQKIIYNSNNFLLKFFYIKGLQIIRILKILLLVFFLKVDQYFVVQCYYCLDVNKIYQIMFIVFVYQCV